MPEIRELLEREVLPLQPPEAWDPVHRRAERRHRHRRVTAAVVALIVAGAGLAGAWVAAGGLRRGPGVAEHGAGSWDGGWIVFQCDGARLASNASSPNLCTMRPDGSDRRLLRASPTPMWDAAWSPDGSRIAFRGYWGDGCEGCSDLYVMDADGSGLTRVTHGALASNPVWSPDGEWIAFDTSGNGSLMKVRPDGTGLTTLTGGAADGFEDTEPTWSADGTHLAFARSAPGNDAGLYAMDANGTGQHAVVMAADVGGPVARPSWSPAGRFLAFVVGSTHASSLWEWDSALEGDPKNHPTRLWSGDGRIWNPQWIEGGAQVAFLRRSGDSTDLEAVRFDGLDPPVRVEQQRGPEGTLQPVVVGSGLPRTIVADFPGDQFSMQPPPGGAAGACAEPGPPQLISCAEAIRSVADVPPRGSSVTARLVRGSLRSGDEGRWVWAIVSYDLVNWIDPPPSQGPLFTSIDYEVDVDAETGRVVAEGAARPVSGTTP